MDLSYKQTIAWDHLHDPDVREVVFGGGAGGGKSYLGCAWVICQCLQYPNTRWVIGRSQLKTLMETTFVSFMKVLQDEKVPVEWYDFNTQKATLTFRNGSVVLFKDLFQQPSDINFDSLGSLEITGAFVDEVSQISEKAWDILRSRIRHGLDENGLTPKILGTCNPSHNFIFEKFFKPWETNELEPSKKFVQSLVKDNPKISKHYIESLQSLDEESRERLLEGNWHYDSDPRALVNHAKIMDCFHSLHIEKDHSRKYISADLAMTGRDSFVVAVWYGDVVEFKIVKKKSDGKEIVDDLLKLSREEGIPQSDIIADSDGMGTYLQGYLKNIRPFHGGGSAVNKKEYANIKSECAFKLAEKINKGKLRIMFATDQMRNEMMPRLIRELSALKQRSIDDDEKRKAIIQKVEMKKLNNKQSPDFLDTLIMGCRFDVGKRFSWVAMAV